MNAARCVGVAVCVLVVALGAPAHAQKGADPDRIRGQIARVDGAAIVVQTRDGKNLRIGLPAEATILTVAKASFVEIDFGKYVGAVSYRLGDDIYSPIRRDSLSWLHKGYELRIIDEELRGIALGHSKWDLTSESVMTHGWVDDMEDRVLSIKYGPTDEEETDVEVPRDAPVHRMSRGDRSMLRAGARVFVGAHRGADGAYAAAFVIVGRDGVVPAL